MVRTTRGAAEELSPTEIVMNLLCFQGQHVKSVHEEIEHDWMSATRTATIHFVPATPRDPGATPIAMPERLFVPLATPPKGSLVTLRAVSSPSGNVRLLTHDDHQLVAVSVLATHAGLTHLLRDHSNRRLREIREFILESKADFKDLVCKTGAGAEAARARVVERFGQLRDRRPGAYDATLVDSFESLCELFESRYLVLVEICPKSVSECEVTWTLEEPPHNAQIPVRKILHIRPLGRAFSLGVETLSDWLGNNRSSAYVQTPLANITNNYHVKMTAPTGRYVYSAGVFTTPREGTEDWPLKDQRTEYPEGLWHGEQRVAPYLHAYIENGTETTDLLGVGTSFAEYPLGSMLGPSLAALLGLACALGFTAFRSNHFFADQNGALVAAVMGGSLAPALAFGRHDAKTARLTARLALLALTLLAFAYSGWWTAPLAANVSLLNTRYALVGIGIVSAYFFVATMCVFSVVRVASDYRWQRRKGYPASTSKAGES